MNTKEEPKTHVFLKPCGCLACAVVGSVYSWLMPPQSGKIESWNLDSIFSNGYQRPSHIRGIFCRLYSVPLLSLAELLRP